MPDKSATTGEQCLINQATTGEQCLINQATTGEKKETVVTKTEEIMKLF
jgi:hypothetical protein